jgi:hypothetical protein
MKWIELTQGKRTCVDDDVFEWASKHKWCAYYNGHTFYAMRNLPRTATPPRRLLHRDILGLTDPAIEGNHTDGNGLNNMRDNLVAVSHAENQRAFQTKRKNTTSRFRGVCWDSQTKNWRAVIAVNRVFQHLGRFDSEEAAARFRDRAALRLFGPIAQLNFPV